MPTYKPQLKALMLHRSQMIINDCRTFLAAKSQSLETYDMVKSGEIGGGNILCAIGLFALLNLLSKVYVLSKNFNKWMIDGSVNETYAFAEFVDYIQTNGLDLGLPTNKNDNKEIWKRLRNALTHMAWPDGAISSHDPIDYNPDSSISFQQLEFMVKGFFPPFRDVNIDRNQTLVCCVDSLYLYMPDIVDSLNKAIDQAIESNVLSTYDWVKR